MPAQPQAASLRWTPWGAESVGGFAVAQMSDTEFLLVGDHVRVRFEPQTPGATVLRIEEGGFTGGKWVMTRVWNGDQTDYGINLIDQPQVLKITTGRVR